MAGNPVIRGLSYEQDKVEPLSKLLRAASSRDALSLIDKFIEFNAELVRRDIADKSFKLGSNFGIDAEGRVVLVDLGELYTGEALKQQRAKRAWDSKFLYRTLVDDEVRAYYLAQMDEHFGLPE